MKHAYLEEEHHIFRDAFRKFLEKEAYPHYNQWEKDGIIPRSLWKKMGQNGFLCSMVEEKYGGAGADFGSFVFCSSGVALVGVSGSAIVLTSCYTFPALASGLRMTPTVLRGPLRVRAFVEVRWPRTGNPLRCRIPR